MLNFCDFIQDYVFTTNHHLKVHVHVFAILTKGVNLFDLLHAFLNDKS